MINLSNWWGQLPNIKVVKAAGGGDFGRNIRNPLLNMFRLKYPLYM